MKSILDITNREEIVEALAEMLMQFQKELNSYQTDIYMYINEETGEATLETFENVGGNSWLNDEHITIYTDGEHYETFLDMFDEPEELAWGIGKTWNQLKDEIIAFFIGSGELTRNECRQFNPDYQDVLYYIDKREDYMDLLKKTHDYYIEERKRDFIEQAEQIIEENEKESIL